MLLSLDSVRADALTFRDRETAPTLAALAERGTVFTLALSGSSWTLPSHAQMFTGQPPQLHGVHHDERKIDPLTQTLPECLSAAGYATVGAWSGWFLAGEYGFGRGFDRYETALDLDGGSNDADPSTRDGFARRENSSHQQITSERLVSMLSRSIAEAPASEPLFVFGHFFDPHYDYIPPAPFDTRFDPDYLGEIDGENFWLNRRVFDAEKRPMRQVNDRDLDHIRALYRGEIAWTDKALGDLLIALERRGRLENTWIIVTSDHGEEFFEHENRGHRQGLYDEVLRVPLLIVPPSGFDAVADVDSLVSLSDIMPTVLDAVGAKRPPSVWGRSLLPGLAGESAQEDEGHFVVSTLTTQVEGDEGSATLVMDSLRGGAMKLIRRTRIPEGGEPMLESAHWFDLRADSAELRPRGNPERPEVAGALRRLELELDKMRTFHEELPHAPAADRFTDVRDIFQTDLGALGYAEGPEERQADEDAHWTLAPLSSVKSR